MVTDSQKNSTTTTKTDWYLKKNVTIKIRKKTIYHRKEEKLKKKLICCSLIDSVTKCQI